MSNSEEYAGKPDSSLFRLVGIVVSAIPFATYAIPLVRASVQLEEKHILYLFNMVVSGAILFITYRGAFFNLDNELLERDKKYFEKKNNKDKNMDIARGPRQFCAINFSFFAVNSVFLVVYLVANFLFKDLFRDIDDVWKFAFISDVAAILTYLPSRSDHYARLARWLNVNADYAKVSREGVMYMLKVDGLRVKANFDKILKMTVYQNVASLVLQSSTNSNGSKDEYPVKDKQDKKIIEITAEKNGSFEFNIKIARYRMNADVREEVRTDLCKLGDGTTAALPQGFKTYDELVRKLNEVLDMDWKDQTNIDLWNSI
jgi:hypothetical protein